ncbi:MAG: DinB family protein [Candidatus Latescibacterota bacterium]|nr:MAG: DinB family protein [Candidatus Latescibacterota bacterium]
MSSHILWQERTFHFDFPVALHREILERLRGTPARVEERVTTFPPEILTLRLDDRWSIQEHAGHLANVESLFMHRLDEYEAGAQTLRAADMRNVATWDANHNAKTSAEVVAEVRRARSAFVRRLEKLHAEAFARSAFHPRLRRQMRLVDMMLFLAEHDDYHLARITELSRALTGE